MRIIHVSDHRMQFNGMVHAAIDLACSQADLGHDVAFCSSSDDFSSLLDEHGVTTFDLRLPINSGTALTSLIQIYRAVRKFRPDIIHAHMTLSALLCYLVSKATRVPLVTCVQNSFSKYAPLMRVGQRVITGCQAVADDMIKRGIPRQRVRPILNGTIGTARHIAIGGQLTTRTEIVISRPAIITACGLHPRKGLPDLINAFIKAQHHIDHLNLYIFGGGPHEAEYKALASGNHRIIFCGQNSVLKPFLEAADVFVLASLADPAPLVICEAREAGLAIVATAVDGIPELLEYGRAGILIPPSSPDSLAEELVMLFEKEGALESWKENSQIGIEKLTVRRVAEATIGVYREISTGGF